MNFAEIFAENLKHALMITGFVMVMMLIIELINVQSKGVWSERIKGSAMLQILVASFLGIIPGCLGVYAVVSLYTHNILSFGALTASMIATSGDETFIMFSMIPATALKITIILFIVAIITGIIVHLLFKKKKKQLVHSQFIFPIHETKENCLSFNFSEISQNFKKISFHRAVLITGLLLFVTGLILGVFGHVHGQTNLEHFHHNEEHDHHWNWVNITFLLLSVIALFIVFFATNHFIHEHLWGHIIRIHFLKIFMWTFGTLIVLGILIHYLHIEDWIRDNNYTVLIIAVLVGLIPVSGPHLAFITLFFYGTIPFSILLANSIVQDGHGGLPLFAESKKSFVLVKFVNLIVGLIIGILGIVGGW